MGSILTSVKESFKVLSALFQLIRTLAKQYNALVSRLNAAPGLPNPNPTSSYWLDQPPYPHLCKRPKGALPDQADVVIIGSGITGASVARTLLLLHPTLKVVVLDARQLCSGATGRNGGHIKVSPYDDLDRLTKRLGRERAVELVRFQMRHLGCLVGLCKNEGWNVAECRVVETVDLFIEGFSDARRKVSELREWIPEATARVWEGEEARNEFGVNERVEGAVSYPAGALFPYRLVTSVWNSLLEAYPDRLTILPETPVLDVTADSVYLVNTGMKSIRAKHVVHATNAFTSELIPGLRGKIAGLLAHMTSQRPGRDFPDVQGNRSWSVIYGKGFEYVTQRPPRADGQQGDVMLGGGWARSKEEGIDMLGQYDDGKTDTFTLAHLFGIFAAIFGKWSGAQGPSRAWTGVIGVTGDMFPFVGRLDPQITARKLRETRFEKGAQVDGMTAPAEWISAGYNGEGMVFAWLCGVALGMMMLGKESAEGIPGIPEERLEEWFPEELYATKERIEKASLANLIDQVL